MPLNDHTMQRRSFLAILLSYVTVKPKKPILALHKTAKYSLGDSVYTVYTIDDELDPDYGKEIRENFVIVGKIWNHHPFATYILDEWCYCVEFYNNGIKNYEFYYESEICQH